MKKIMAAFLLTAAFVPSASAQLTPYVSAKLAYAHIKNDVDNTLNLDYGSESINVPVVNKELSDNKNGLRLAAGVTVPVDEIWGDIRAEIEYAYNFKTNNTFLTTLEGDGGDGAVHYKNKLRSNVLFLNTYYDLETCTDFIPYVGAGIGYARLRNKATLTDGSLNQTFKDENFAWNIGFGLGYIVSENVTLDMGYRYTDYGSLSGHSQMEEFPGGMKQTRSKYDVTSHEVSVGLRYHF